MTSPGLVFFQVAKPAYPIYHISNPCANRGTRKALRRDVQVWCVFQVQMLQRAAGLAAGEESEEAWYLVHLFQCTQPRELLRICHFTLATFLELNYEYFDEGWPLQSRLVGSSTFAPTASSSSSSFCRSACILKGKAERLQSRSPPPSQIAEETLTVTHGRQPSMGSRTERSAFATSKSTSKRLAWLKGKYLLPSKLSVFTPNSSPASMTNMNRSVSGELWCGCLRGFPN